MKILHISMIAPDIEHFGGAERTNKIKNKLKEKHEIKSIHVHHWNALSDEYIEEDDYVLILGREDMIAKSDDRLNFNFGLVSHITRSKRIIFNLNKFVKRFNPDFVLIEQPYLYFLAKTLNYLKDAKLILSSHNLERDFFENDRHLIVEAENYFRDNAYRVLCTTQSEKDFYGDKAKVFPNASDNLIDTKLDHWKNELDNGHVNYVFIGGYHPPNFESINALTKHLKDDNVKIWVVGECGKDVDESPSINTLNVLSKEDMDGITLASDGLINPIIDGGGTSLKVAKYLLTNKPIISTNFGMRGFEEYIDEGVYCYDNLKELAESLSTKRPEFKRNNNLTWDEALKDIKSFIEN